MISYLFSFFYRGSGSASHGMLVYRILVNAFMDRYCGMVVYGKREQVCFYFLMLLLNITAQFLGVCLFLVMPQTLDGGKETPKVQKPFIKDVS